MLINFLTKDLLHITYIFKSHLITHSLAICDDAEMSLYYISFHHIASLLSVLYLLTLLMLASVSQKCWYISQK